MPRRRRVPFIPQLETSDCGAACAAMALARHRVHVRLADLRQLCGHGRSGAHALDIAKALRQHGLRVQGVRASVDGLQSLPAGSILHWDFHHFVVLEKATPDIVEVVDPQLGRRRLSRQAVSRSFTGIALRVDPPERRPPNAVSRREALGRGHVRRLVWPITKKTGGAGGLLAVSVLLRLLLVAVPIAMGLAIDQVATGDARRAGWVLVAAAAVVALYTFGFSLVRLGFIVRLRALVLYELTGKVVDHLVHLPYPFFAERSVGDLVTRLRGLGLLRDLLTAAAVMLIIDAALAAVYLVVLVAIDPLLALVAGCFAGGQVLAIALSQQRYANATAESIQAEAASQSYLYQMLAGIETLQAAAAEDEAVRHWKTLLTEEINSASERVRIGGVVESVLGALRVTGPLAVIAVGVAAGGDDVTAGGIVAAAALATALAEPLTNVFAIVLQLQLVGSYATRLADILETGRDDQSLLAPAPVVEGAASPAETPQLSFDAVSYRHPGAAADTVSDVSFAVWPGEFVALVGPSGAGKSTVLHLALGMLLPSAGTVAWDGNPTTSVDRVALRRRLGVVVQEPFMFGGSIRENIAFGSPGASLADLVSAAEQACIHDDIAELPMAYDTVLAERGASLSGGQRQRIALARALVGRPQMLVLDEATSALDAVTEDRVYKNLRGLGVTVLVAAHRLSTIEKADRIAVFDRGRVVEAGDHSELIAARGLYWSLTRGQGD